MHPGKIPRISMEFSWSRELQYRCIPVLSSCVYMLAALALVALIYIRTWDSSTSCLMRSVRVYILGSSSFVRHLKRDSWPFCMRGLHWPIVPARERYIGQSIIYVCVYIYRDTRKISEPSGSTYSCGRSLCAWVDDDDDDDGYRWRNWRRSGKFPVNVYLVYILLQFDIGLLTLKNFWLVEIYLLPSHIHIHSYIYIRHRCISWLSSHTGRDVKGASDLFIVSTR